MQTLPPTTETYQEFQTAFDFFNAELFGDAMPHCLITLQRHTRSMGYYHAERFVSHDGMSRVDEIALNPTYFAVQTIENTLSTLVHEMVHLWQFHNATPSRTGYHNKEWAKRMEVIGLMPSHTGRAGGRKVGQQMDHYVIAGGPFSATCATLLTRDFRLSWFDRFTAPVPGWTLGAAVAVVSSLEGLNALVTGEVEADAVGEAKDTDAAPPPGFSLDTLDSAVISALQMPEKARRSNRSKYRCPVCAAQVWGKPGLSVLCGAMGCACARMVDVSEG